MAAVSIRSLVPKLAGYTSGLTQAGLIMAQEVRDRSEKRERLRLSGKLVLCCGVDGLYDTTGGLEKVE